MDSYLEFKDGFRLEIKKASLTLRSKILEPLQIIEKESLSISSTQSKLLCARIILGVNVLPNDQFRITAIMPTNPHLDLLKDIIRHKQNTGQKDVCNLLHEF